MFKGVSGSLRGMGKDPITINSRHRECLMRAGEGLGRAGVTCRKKLPMDFVAIDVKDAVMALGEVSGELVSEEVINRVFDQFCVGK
jgi:tRNA modification GTPase